MRIKPGRGMIRMVRMLRPRPRWEVASKQEAWVELHKEIIPLKQKKTDNLWATTYLFYLFLNFVICSDEFFMTTECILIQHT